MLYLQDQQCAGRAGCLIAILLQPCRRQPDPHERPAVTSSIGQSQAHCVRQLLNLATTPAQTRLSSADRGCCRTPVLQEFLSQHNDAAGDALASTAAAAASAAAAAAGEGGQRGGEPLSLWHEMQKRQQAEEAALESELSAGPGLQGPGGIFGEDLWMFDGGLFAEEGELLQENNSCSSAQPLAACAA